MPAETVHDTRPGGRRRGRWVLWLPGLAVALGAATATAHGLFEVARAAGAPAPIAGLYPLITDGLALVAYATTTRLPARSRRYAWTIVVLAAGLSGLAQACYLAGGVPSAPPALRFGVGAWPAIAAALVAHLLFLIGTTGRPACVQPTTVEHPTLPAVQAGVHPAVQHTPAVQPGVHLNTRTATAVQLGPSTGDRRPTREGADRTAVEQLPAALADATPGERARTVALGHRARLGALPTVSELERHAAVSRGTAAQALRELRAATNGHPEAAQSAENGPIA